MPAPRGRHVLADLKGCPADLIDDPDRLALLACRAAEYARATVLDVTVHRFTPQGVTLLLLLAESHLAIHTWPEDGTVAIDVFTCGDCSPEAAVMVLCSGLAPESVDQQEIRRHL